MRSRTLALLCVVTLVAAATACGSRLSDEELATGAGGGGGGGGGAAAGRGGGGGGEGAMVGTLPSPCGPGGSGGGAAPAPAPSADGSTTAPAPGASPAPTTAAPAPGGGGQTPGVTADTIRIGVISDKAGPVPLPTVGIEESVQAFVTWCNEQGGVNGRQLELLTYDSQVFRNAEATQQACQDDLFALVGSGSVLDQQGAQIRVDCGLVEVGAYAATIDRGNSTNFFQPVPVDLNQYNVGPCLYLAEQFPDAVKKASSVYINIAASENRARSQIEACEEHAGFEFVFDEAVPPLNKNWGPIVTQMEDAEAQYFTMVSTTDDTAGLLQAMGDQGFEAEPIDLGQQYYDPRMLGVPGAEGAYVLSNTAPFSEADDNPALQVYVEYLEKVAPDIEPTTLGVQAFSAGLLFAQAASSLGDNLTRAGLVTALENIHEWDGGGLQMPADPGAQGTVTCFLYLRIEGGEFVRAHPEEGYDCDPSYVVDLEGDYGQGATAAGA